MKSILLVLTLFVSASAFSQTIPNDTLIVNNDTIIKSKAAIWIQPVVVNAKGDTAVSLNFIAGGVTSDTLSGCQTYVWLMDKHGRNIADFNQPIPASVVNQWAEDPKPMFDYILLANPRFRRLTISKP